MSVLNHLGQAAAMLLLIELIVLTLIVLAVAGGLAFGLNWVRGKTGWAFGKANTYLGMGVHYVDLGLNYAAKPVIMASGFAETVKGTAIAIRRRIRAASAARQAQLTATTQRVLPAVPPTSSQVTEEIGAMPVSKPS